MYHYLFDISSLFLIYSFIMISRLDIHGVLMYRKNILSATDEDADSDIKKMNIEG